MARRPRRRAFPPDARRRQTTRLVRPTSRAANSRQGIAASAGRSSVTCSIARRRSSSPDGSKSYVHGRIRSGTAERAVQPSRQRFAREQDQISRLVDQLEVLGLRDQRRDDVDSLRARQRERLEDVVGAAFRGAHEPDPGPSRKPGDLVHQLDVRGTDEHGHHRDTTCDERLGLIGVERRGRHEVVVEPLEPLRQIVEKRAFGFDRPREGVDQAFGVVARVGVRALGEQDPNERAGSLPLGGCRERGRSQLVCGEPGMGSPAQHLGHDPGQRLRSAALRRPVGDMGAGTVSTRDVPGVGQTSIDRPDGVGVHSESGTKLTDGLEPRTRQQPAGIDLVRQLPVDLGRDGNVRVTLDIERAAHARRPDRDRPIVT